jgi:sulfhydrogenase subunit alpha
MAGKKRTIRVEYLPRVEGEGSLTIRLRGDRATEVRLEIFEPPRFFEALLRGRSYVEAPDITSRICGICPVAYLLSACQAMEDALGIPVDEEIRALRRLIYCGEWIESHALHVFFLHAPDFLGYPDGIAMARDHREWVERGLRMKKAGNALVALMGGREIHPINVRVGGFYRVPSRSELQGLLPDLRQGRQDAIESLAWLSGLSFPELERDYEFVALSHPEEYPFCEGRIVSSRGLDIEVRHYDGSFAEEQAPYSNALRSRVIGRDAYLCGPLARFNLNYDRLDREVQELARQAGLGVPCRNPYRMLLVRMIEVIHSFTEAIRIIEAYRPPARPWVDAEVRAGTGYGATEAPRGLLYHRYTLDSAGTIVDARIVPPTSQNQLTMEHDLAAIAPVLAALPYEEARSRAEQTVRNHDPCISCATHFLELRIERG